MIVGMDDEICPYATFHLLGFREEMDPTKAMQFQTFPHPHTGTMGPSGINTPHQMHSRAGSQSMPRQNRRYDRVGSQGLCFIYLIHILPVNIILLPLMLDGSINLFICDSYTLFVLEVLILFISVRYNESILYSILVAYSHI